MAYMRIMVVEDERITALDICQLVRELGHAPIGPVASGEKAFAVALSERPDLILMEITLKGTIDGIETAVAIRPQHPCPVIFVTAYSDEATRNRARIAEPPGWVLKPVMEGELQGSIERALCRPVREEQEFATGAPSVLRW